MLDVCVIGHVTRDIIRINNREKELPGGTAYYSSMALKSLGLNVAVVTKIAHNDSYLLDDLNRNNISVVVKMSPKTTVFTNSYDGYLNPGDYYRTQKVRSIAAPFSIEDIADISPTIFHIGSLTKGDIPLDVLKFLARKSIISLDVQGFLREVAQGSVKIKDWDEKHDALSHIDIVKADETEAKILTGEEDMEKAAKTLSAFGPQEVIITLGSNGSLIYCKEKFYRIPPCLQERIIDPTGCGDTYMAGYLYKRLESIGSILDFNKIGKFSASIASLKLGRHGPFKGSREEVEYSLETRDEFESFNNRHWKRW